jgi:hypothetical protein
VKFITFSYIFFKNEEGDSGGAWSKKEEKTMPTVA